MKKEVRTVFMNSICGIIDYWGEGIGDTIKIPSEKNDLLGRDRGMRVALGSNDDKKWFSRAEAVYDGIKYVSVCDGEIYNNVELKSEIISKIGFSPFADETDAEIVLWLYITRGGESPILIDGIFSFAVYSETTCKQREYVPKLFVARDKFGIKRFFYTYTRQGVVFSSSLRDLSFYDSLINLEVDKYGLFKLFFLADKYLSGTVFRGIEEIGPGCCAYLDCRRGGGRKFIEKKYWDVGSDEQDFESQQYGDYIRSAFKNSLLKRTSGKENIYEFENISDELVLTSDYIDTPWIESPFDDLQFEFFCQCMKAKLCNSDLVIKDIFTGFNDRFVLYRPYFPWIKDPYLLSEFVNDDVFDQSDGFNYILEFYNDFKTLCVFSEDDCQKIKNHKLNTYLYFKAFYPSKYRISLQIANYFNLSASDILTDGKICSGIFNLPIGMSSEKVFISRRDISCSKIIVPESIKSELVERIQSIDNGFFSFVNKNKLTEAAHNDTDSNQLDLNFKILLWFYKTYIYFYNLGTDFCI